MLCYDLFPLLSAGFCNLEQRKRGHREGMEGTVVDVIVGQNLHKLVLVRDIVADNNML